MDTSGLSPGDEVWVRPEIAGRPFVLAQVLRVGEGSAPDVEVDIEGQNIWCDPTQLESYTDRLPI